ncbi:MAG: alpha/beta fold hydrolase [Syntrophomonadaceae bacterium]
MGLINPQAASFLVTGSKDTACMFIHGFTASPSEVYSVARIVYAETGMTVSGPLLPGHGCSPQEMNQTRWEDWYGRVEQEIGYLKKKNRQVYITGLSMGGLLALHAASETEEIDGVIIINTPIYTTSSRLMSLAPLLRYFKPYYPKKLDGDLDQLARQGRFAYDVMPLKALRSMHALRDKVIKELPGLELPILLMQSRWDETVDPRSARFIKEKAQRAEVRLVELENSGHIATMGPDTGLIADQIIDFVNQN